MCCLNAITYLPKINALLDDMAYNYSEDHQPHVNATSSAYHFTYWDYIDIFIYFSHHRITIPPSAWTVAAHRNGVKCLGTIITEHAIGIRENKKLLNGKSQRPFFYADKLVELACYYGFDGW